MVYSIWEKHSIRCVTNIITKGATPTTYGYDFVEHGEDAIRFIGAYNCSIDGRFKSNSDKWITTDANKMIKRSILESGDSIFCIVGNTIGSSFKVTRDILPANINQNVALIRPDQKKINEDFLHYYLRSTYIQWQVQQEASIQAQPSLSLQQIGNFKINVPPLPEQIKIAEILSTWDNAINTVQKLLANSQQQKKALMQKLLTGKKRFAEFEGEWEEKRLSRLLKVTGGNAFKSESFADTGVPLIKISNIKTDFSVSVDSCVFHPYEQEFAKFNVQYGDILIAMSGATTGKVGRYFGERLCYLNQRVGRFDLKKELASPDFIFQILKLPYIQHEILIDAVGGAQPNISNKEIERIKIKAPSLAEQQKIAAVLTTADQEIDNLRAQLNHLKQEKKALMQQLLTGKRRVKVEEAA